MSFDFYARYGLFTYAQSNGLDPWQVSDHFTELGAECIIGEEAHADGGTHLHVFADWGRRKRFRRANIFDVDNHHPNIVASRGTPSAGFDYATKDGNIVAGGLGRPNESGDAILRKDAIWHTIMDASSREQFFELVRELAPADLAKCYPSLCKYADFRYAPPELVYGGPTREDPRFEISQYPDLVEWCQGFDQRCDEQLGKFKHAPLSGPLTGPRGALWRLTPPLARIRSAHEVQAEADPSSYGDQQDWENPLGLDPWDSTYTLLDYSAELQLLEEAARPLTPSSMTLEEESSSSRDSRIGLDASPVSWSSNYTGNQS